MDIHCFVKSVLVVPERNCLFSRKQLGIMPSIIYRFQKSKAPINGCFIFVKSGNYLSLRGIIPNYFRRRALRLLTNSGHPLFVQCEMSERIRLARTVPEAAVALTAAEK